MSEALDKEGRRQHELLTARKNNLISFRLDPESLQLLAIQSIEGEKKLNKTARRILVNSLQRQLELEILHQDNARLHRETVELKEMFLKALPAILSSGGKVSADEATSWVNRKFPCSPSRQP